VVSYKIALQVSFASFIKDAVFSNCSAGATNRKQDFQIILKLEKCTLRFSQLIKLSSISVHSCAFHTMSINALELSCILRVHCMCTADFYLKFGVFSSLRKELPVLHFTETPANFVVFGIHFSCLPDDGPLLDFDIMQLLNILMFRRTNTAAIFSVAVFSSEC
jgi:hypothetical protein